MFLPYHCPMVCRLYLVTNYVFALKIYFYQRTGFSVCTADYKKGIIVVLSWLDFHYIWNSNCRFHKFQKMFLLLKK